MLCECGFLGIFLFDCFLVFPELSIGFLFGLPDVVFVAIFAWNGLDYTVRFFFFFDLLERDLSALEISRIGESMNKTIGRRG